MRVLAVGAHPDDVELGCGGALLVHRDAGDELAILVMTAGERGPSGRDPRWMEQEAATSALSAKLFWGGFTDCAIPSGQEAVAVVEEVLGAFEPDLVYAHSTSDSHQDHRHASRATLSACRRLSSVLFYESPSTREFVPSVFVDLDDHIDAKLDLIRAHRSQVEGNSRVDLQAVEAQARFRGFQARVRFAEGFVPERLLTHVSPGQGSLNYPSSEFNSWR